MSTSGAPTYHHGSLRTALLAEAMEMLAEQGAEALSLRAVARRAGVSAMAPYRHYPDKESLLAAVAAQGFDSLRATLQAADDAAAPGCALVEQAVAYVGFANANPALFRLMFGPRHPGACRDLDRASAAAYAVLADRVARDTPAALRGTRVLGCWSLVHGLASLALDGRLSGKTPGVPGAPPAPIQDTARAVARSMFGAT